MMEKKIQVPFYFFTVQTDILKQMRITINNKKLLVLEKGSRIDNPNIKVKIVEDMFYSLNKYLNIIDKFIAIRKKRKLKQII